LKQKLSLELKMIKVQNTTKIYPPNLTKTTKIALSDVSFEIKDGEFLTISGRSGAGKTTILKIISAQEKPTKGKIFFDNQNISQFKDKDIHKLRQKIGFIFQDYKLLSYKTVFENIAYSLEVTEFKDDLIEKEVGEVLELVGLENQADYFPGELSGGEKQRTAIARALIHRPKVILADEPTGNLDPYHSRDILKMLLKINQLGATIILATHSKEIINSLQKRVITLQDGKIIKDEPRGRFIL